MNKSAREKCLMLMLSVLSRLDNERDAFRRVEFTLKSGLKSFDGAAVLNENTLEMTFMGNKRSMDYKSFAKWLASEATAYDELRLSYGERMGCTVIEASDKTVKSYREKEPPTAAVPVNSAREYVIKTGSAGADRLLRVIGILTDEKNGRTKVRNDMIRKYSQIDHFVELIAPILNANAKEKLVVWDLACGKSYLSFVVNYYIREVLRKRCSVVGVDISEGVITESKRMADELGYENMEFICADLRDFHPSQKPDLVISLHACDIATDLALGAAVKNTAGAIVCVPCCHKELLNQYDIPGLGALTRGIFRARFNDVLTDSLRCLRLEAEGYRVSAVEYISPLDTPKNLMIRAERGLDQKRREQAKIEYKNACNILGVFPALAKELD